MFAARIRVTASYSLVVKWSEDVVPTVAFNLRKVRKGNVTLKIWDVAGTHPHCNSCPFLACADLS